MNKPTNKITVTSEYGTFSKQSVRPLRYLVIVPFKMADGSSCWMVHGWSSTQNGARIAAVAAKKYAGQSIILGMDGQTV